MCTSLCFKSAIISVLIAQSHSDNRECNCSLHVLHVLHFAQVRPPMSCIPLVILTHMYPHIYMQGEGYLVTMVHSDGGEGEEVLRTHLLHQAHLVLHVEGLATGYSKEIHGEVRNVVYGMYTPAWYHCIHIVAIITESVDSVCRDTTYTQYMPIQKNLSKSQKRYTYKPL